MADSWATTDMAAALPEASPAQQGVVDPPRDYEKPQMKGWEEKTPYDYEKYNADKDTMAKMQEEGMILPWASSAVRYEWSDEYGEVGPEIPELERQLFDVESVPTLGDNYDKLKNIKIVVEGSHLPDPVKSFVDAGLHPLMLENVQKSMFRIPTPIQAWCIPTILLGHDVMGIAQTGSGKTVAYLLPILSKLMGKAKKLAAPRPNPKEFDAKLNGVRAEPLVLILVPTRELAIQIFGVARKLCYRTMLRPGVLYGGAPIREQREDMQRGCDILIGTPGRLMDFIVTQGIVNLRRVKYTVIDEADELLQADWDDALKAILTSGSAQDEGDHQYMMFSATFSKEARKLARGYLADNYVRIRVGRTGSTHKNIVQRLMFVEGGRKLDALYDLLMAEAPCRTMIFVNSVRTCDIVDDYLYAKDFPVTAMHSQRTQREREDAVRHFISGKAPILVTTGVSARGLDIKNILHIINFDIPSAEHGGIDEYVHRIGRTARIGNLGLATAFYNERDEAMAENIVKVIMECEQEVPDFLEEYRPADGNLNWDDDTDDEAPVARVGDIDGDAWGSAAPAKAKGDSWGGSGAAANGDSWGGDATAANADVAQSNDSGGDSWGPVTTGGNW